jgi:hypothetical protein
VIDEDLGRSASGTVTRVGFERMVAEVCLWHVGAVAAREVSRFARDLANLLISSKNDFLMTSTRGTQIG